MRAPLLLAALFHQTPALAEEFDRFKMGLFLGYTTGDAGGLTWGAEAFISNQQPRQYLEPEQTWSWGPVMRLSFHGLSSPFLSAGANVRYGFDDLVGLEGELGVTAAFLPGGTSPRFSPYTGLGSELVILNVFARQYWMLESFAFGGGLRWPPIRDIDGGGEVVVGRPQRNAEGSKVQSAEPSNTAHAVGVTSLSDAGALRAALAADWQAQAQQEYDSVPAFLDLAVQLRAVQAPRSLVAGAMHAAGDELRHAQMAAALCAHFGGAPALKVPSAGLRSPLTGDAALERLAREAWLDGCIGEGIASALAADEAEHALEPQLARTQRTIAEDEARHAALAWRTLAHCVKRKPAVLSVLRQSTPDLSPPAVRVGSRARREWIAARHVRKAQARLEQMA